MEKDQLVKSVSRALDIIALVATKKEGLGVTEITKQMDINKSNVYRILSTLAHYGYVEQDADTSRYKLGLSLLEMSTKLVDSLDLRTVAMPILRELEKHTAEVIHLVVYDKGDVVYIEKIEGSETLRMHSKVGRRAPLHCTGVGKAILAHLPKAVAEDMLAEKGLPYHTEHTLTNPDHFLKELEMTKQRGYAFDLEENEIGINCVAAPIFDHLGQAISALSVSGPSIRMTPKRLNELADHVVKAGLDISRKLGYKNTN